MRVYALDWKDGEIRLPKNLIKSYLMIAAEYAQEVHWRSEILLSISLKDYFFLFPCYPVEIQWGNLLKRLPLRPLLLPLNLFLREYRAYALWFFPYHDQGDDFIVFGNAQDLSRLFWAVAGYGMSHQAEFSSPKDEESCSQTTVELMILPVFDDAVILPPAENSYDHGGRIGPFIALG